MNRRALGALACVLALACRKPGSEGPGAAVEDPLAEARSLVERGQFDEALARLQASSEPESLFLQGLAWARKAEKAPLPTPAPGAPAAPEWKPEEVRALDLFERAIAARPDHAGAHLALGQLLAPHAVARAEREAAAAAQARRRKGKAVEAPLPPAEGPDASPAHVVREFQRAAQGDVTAKAPVEALIAFAVKTGRLGDAESGFQELLKREREKPEPFVRYGDFLREQKRDADGAIAQYRQALIWRPEDDATRAKIADIYIGMARAHVDAREYATADARLREAEKYITDGTSPQAQRLQEQQAFLAQIRGRAPGR